MKYVISLFLATTITFLYSYFLLFDKMPESIQVNGYIHYIMKAPSAFFGAFIGAYAASFFAFSPTIMKIPGHLLSSKGRFTMSSEPIKAIGKLISKNVTQSHTNLLIQYDNRQTMFSVDNRVISCPLSNGNEVVVYYDPNKPELAYIDFYQINEITESNIKKSETLFKLLDITPKFDISKNSFELLGEIYGGDYQGKKASMIISLPREEIAHYTPGKLLPCIINGTKNDYSIQLLAIS